MKDLNKELSALNKRLEEAGDQDLKREVVRLEYQISNVEYLILNGVEFVEKDFHFGGLPNSK